MLQQPQFRRDPFRKYWSIIAPERAARPQSRTTPLPRQSIPDDPSLCPFCPGQEDQTPPAVLTYPALPGSEVTAEWRLRVVPNRYPAVRPDVPLSYCLADDTYATSPAFGRSEVVIETPRHLDDPNFLTTTELADLFRAYQDRLLALSQEPMWSCAAVFKNVGAEAGASLRHTHSQILALPVLPPLLSLESASCLGYFQRTRHCLTCALVARELDHGQRLIARSKHFAVLSAYAPRFPYELWLTPLEHQARFEYQDPATFRELAQLWQQILVALDHACQRPAYNWILYTAPWQIGSGEHWHWRLELLPRLARPAGLEWGFHCYIVAVTPEEAAGALRRHLPADPGSASTLQRHP
jgi:UDPglucose--hexose-1-phosphate uridylyltransferase